MKILITGVSGFVGSYLLEKLFRNSEESLAVHGTYVNNKEQDNISHWKEKINLHACDISNADQVQAVIKEVQPDQVYHLAAMSSGAAEDREKVLAVNVVGTLNILQACQDLNKKVRVLLTSTGYVYGSSAEQQPFSEEDKPQPMGVYAESKYEMEKKVLAADLSNVEIIISRAFNHTGPKQTPDFVVPAFAKQIAEIEAGRSQPTLFVGNLEAIRDFFDVRDAVKAYTLLMSKGKSGEIYNVASGQAIQISEILDKLLTLSAKKINIEQDKDRMRPSDLAHCVGSYDKIQNELGWEPEINFDNTLSDVLDYWRTEIADNKQIV
ncbi:GDP-mannose 4,6-dehydratase [Patescibacteria group bacterium]|nr:GDP-mannose 4,6-dehydratase [Patescibacteria group bacterium]